MLELLRGDLQVMFAAKVLGVLVGVQTAMRKRDLVIDYRGNGDTIFSDAMFAKAIGASESALPLLLPCTTAKAFNRWLLSH